jgi:UDP-glucose 4-epimerase
VYGQAAGVADETSATAPLTAYGADKRGSELHAAAGGLVHGIPSLGLRFFNVYGPRQDPNSPYSGVISIFAKAIASRQTVTINGDGRQTRDFIFVGDIVRFLTAGMSRLVAGGAEAAAMSGGVLNACTGRETSVLELAHLIGELIGCEAHVVHGPARPGDIGRSVGSPARAASVLGLTARTGLRTGLEATLAGLSGRSKQQAA